MGANVKVLWKCDHKYKLRYNLSRLLCVVEQNLAMRDYIAAMIFLEYTYLYPLIVTVPVAGAYSIFVTCTKAHRWTSSPTSAVEMAIPQSSHKRFVFERVNTHVQFSTSLGWWVYAKSVFLSTTQGLSWMYHLNRCTQDHILNSSNAGQRRQKKVYCPD